MLTPVKYGGFGLVDLKDINDALDLKAYSRLQSTNHVFLAQVRDLINSRNFFKVSAGPGLVDRKLRRGIELLNSDREKICSWPPEEVASNVFLRDILLNTRLKDLIKPVGLQSLHYFSIARRIANPLLQDVSQGELNTVQRFLIRQDLGPILNLLLQGPNHLNLNVNMRGRSEVAYPVKTGVIKNMSALSSKEIRAARSLEISPICIYKLGPILTPGELISWSNKLKKLTSTRHRNILLRAMHGDIFSNSRLFKFGLRDSPACANCDEQIETIQHRLLTCPKANRAWENLEEVKGLLTMNSLTDLTMENIVGAKDNISVIELALQAELILRLSTKSDGYQPEQLVRATALMIGHSEKLNPEMKEAFKRFKRAG